MIGEGLSSLQQTCANLWLQVGMPKLESFRDNLQPGPGLRVLPTERAMVEPM